ncbi:MAG: xanthine phosphoribosyltransferase [Treponema sp.]|jgi:xanthine phosphoribosyltransferase|nr:xanthine phosphoribosyltransferase [Treponema sp.]
MQLLKERILTEGIVMPGNILNVSSFLNQQVDIDLYNEIGREFFRLFLSSPINKILTIEASGIGIACITAQYFKVPVVFARKFRAKNVENDLFCSTVTSYTHGIDYTITVPKPYLKESDTVLLIDDFLANGCALEGLIKLVQLSGAKLAGAGAVIEKGFQGGGKRIREQGVRLESLAIIESMDGNGIKFK